MVCNHWQPGEILHISQGAKEVQEAFDALADRLCVIHWLAPWSASNQELGVELVFRRLAQDFPAVVFLQLSISSNHRCQGPNRLWALKTVCRRADSRRTGAYPILREDGEKFPCFTVHVAPSAAQVVQRLTGAAGLGKLHTAVAHHLAQTSEEAQTVPSCIVKWECSQEEAPPAGDAQDAPEGVTFSSSRLEPEALAGAAHLKVLLAQADQHGCILVVLWLSSKSSSLAEPNDLGPRAEQAIAPPDQTAGQQAEAVRLQVECAGMRKALQELHQATQPGLLACTADMEQPYVRQLGAAFKVGHLPTCHVFRDRQRTHMIKGLNPAKLRAAVQQGSEPEPEAPTTAVEHGGAEAQPVLFAEVPGRGGAEPPVAAQNATEGPIAGASSVAQACQWDPPTGKAAKGGTERRVGGKVCVFYPRMPCLQCGCPWWAGEDWDAECARCKWISSEEDYDDDSNPLPKFRTVHASFVAEIQEGHTPAWSHQL